MNLRDLMPGGLFGGGGALPGGIALGGQDSGNRLGGTNTVPGGSPLTGGANTGGGGRSLQIGTGAGQSAAGGSGAQNGGVSARGRQSGFNPGALGDFLGNADPNYGGQAGIPPGTSMAYRTGQRPLPPGSTMEDAINAGRYDEAYSASHDPFGAAMYAFKVPSYEAAKLASEVWPGQTDNINAGLGIAANVLGGSASDLAITRDPATGVPTSRSGLDRILSGEQGVYDALTGGHRPGPADANITIGGYPGGIRPTDEMLNNAVQETYPPYPESGGVAMNPTLPPGNNMPVGPFSFPDLVPDPGGTASNINTPGAPPPGSVDLGPGTHSGESGGYHPYIAPDPRYDASRSGGAAPGVYDDPILAQAYSNTSGAGTSALNMNSAMSHPSYSQYYQDYLRSHPNG